MILNHSIRREGTLLSWVRGKIYESIRLVLRRKSSGTNFPAFRNPA